MCAESVRATALLCRYCGYDFRTGVRHSAAAHANGLAVASLVLGILWLYWIGSILVLIFGYRARSQIKAAVGLQRGLGMALAGIALGWLALSIVAISVLIVALSDNNF
jgi:hypothetical protein